MSYGTKDVNVHHSTSGVIPNLHLHARYSKFGQYNQLQGLQKVNWYMLESL